MFTSRGQTSSSAITGRVKRVILPFFLSFLSYSLSGCSLQPKLEREQIGDLGYFEYRAPQAHMAGVVIGAPHGRTHAQAAMLARQIAESTGAGLVVGHGFKSRRISVAQPVVRTYAARPVRVDWSRRGSVFREFKQILREVSNGEVDFYVELRLSGASAGRSELNVTSSGVSFEEIEIIKQLYFAAFDRVRRTNTIEKLPLAIDSIGQISADTWGIRHHGVLMIAKKGLSLRIPERFLDGQDLTVFGEVLSAWVGDTTRLLQENRDGVPRIKVKLMDFGRIDSIPSRARQTGVVIGAPHGSYDAYTAELVKQWAFQTGLAAVIARGFTPTESGDGRRINVNRPTERHVSLSDREFETARARATYGQFKSAVLSAAGGNLDLYIDIHHNNGPRIEVATVGLSKEEARVVKNAYRALRDQALAGRPDISVVELAIEPLEVIEVGAWAAKTNGILTLARRSLHFELPANPVISSARQREMYALVLARLIGELPTVLPAPVN